MRYHLYAVSCTGGFYPVLSATPPTTSYKDLSDLEEIYQRLRPGHGKTYVTTIVRCDENGNVNEEDASFMRREAEILVSLQL